MSKDLSDQRILESWHKNVAPWTQAVRKGEIASRELLTNQAIVDAVLATQPTSALDIGCGEGWLTRALSQQGIITVGVDAVADLIHAARLFQQQDNQPPYAQPIYKQLSYEQIIDGALEDTFDTLVCNFSLLGKESVEGLFVTFRSLLSRKGHIVIQTPHPLTHAGATNQSGWRTGSWAGFNDAFTDPAPWYFRTLDDWRALFNKNGLTLTQEISPAVARPTIALPAIEGNDQPNSIIFVAQMGVA